jgi:hypothetical protein
MRAQRRRPGRPRASPQIERQLSLARAPFPVGNNRLKRVYAAMHPPARLSPRDTVLAADGAPANVPP